MLTRTFFIKSQVILWEVEVVLKQRVYYQITIDFMGGGGGAG
jgi:hypothetical protein